MIVYNKLFELMKAQGKNITHIRNEKIVGQETLRKLKAGTGVIEEYDYKVPSTGQKEKRIRESPIDTKAIESLCTWLKCQPNDIMEVIPNTWDNADRLCEILHCTKEKKNFPIKYQWKNDYKKTAYKNKRSGAQSNQKALECFFDCPQY